MNNYNDKILIIKENEKKLLELAKAKITESGNVFNENIKNVVQVLDYDTKMVKKYEAVVEAEEMIEELIVRIKNATSVEEIIEVRKKLNYYINKIKNELKKRNIDDGEYEKYVANATNLRKNISEYIRYFKREDKITEMDYLNDQADLSDEEENRLNKLVKNELSYGKRNLKKQTEIKDNTVELTKKESETVKAVPAGEIAKRKIKLHSYDNVYDYLDDQVGDFYERYHIKTAGNYGKNFIKNLVVFTKNIPTIVKNKSRVKYMVRDYNLFHRQSELIGYSEYTKKDNSIFTNIKKALKGSSLVDKEDYYAEEHNKCINWIIEFCKNNNLDIRFSKMV